MFKKNFKRIIAMALTVIMMMGMSTSVFAVEEIPNGNIAIIEGAHDIAEIDLINEFKINQFDDIAHTKYYDLNGKIFYRLSSAQLIEAFSALAYGDKDYILNNEDCDTISISYVDGCITLETEKMEYSKSRVVSTYTKTASTSRVIMILGLGTKWTMNTTYVESTQPIGVYIEDSTISSAPYGKYNELSESGRENTQSPSGHSGMTDKWTIGVYNDANKVEYVSISTKSNIQ